MKKTVNFEVLQELFAEQVHNLWWNWSRNIAKEEKISEKRIKRWKSLWIPYYKLSENMKELDRKYAKPFLEIVEILLNKEVNND